MIQLSINEDRDFRKQFEADMLRFKLARRNAEETVRDRGWTEKDEDFEIQVEEEAKKQWFELYEQDHPREELWDRENESDL